MCIWLIMYTAFVFYNGFYETAENSISLRGEFFD